jgi:hypothetical protein
MVSEFAALIPLISTQVQLINYTSRVYFQSLIVAQLFKKYLALFLTRWLITIQEPVNGYVLSRLNPISRTPYFPKIRVNIALPCTSMSPIAVKFLILGLGLDETHYHFATTEEIT